MPRPTKRTPETEKRILDLLRAGNTRKTAYTAAGISDQTFANWLVNLDFLDAVKRAEEEAVARNVAIVNQAASKSWQAAAWWLERRRPADFKLRDETEHTGTIRVVFGDDDSPPRVT